MLQVMVISLVLLLTTAATVEKDSADKMAVAKKPDGFLEAWTQDFTSGLKRLLQIAPEDGARHLEDEAANEDNDGGSLLEEADHEDDDCGDMSIHISINLEQDSEDSDDMEDGEMIHESDEDGMKVHLFLDDDDDININISLNLDQCCEDEEDVEFGDDGQQLQEEGDGDQQVPEEE